MGSQARATQLQCTHFVRTTVAYNTNNINNGVLVGHIPAGARISKVDVFVETAANAGTTNTVSVGLVQDFQGQPSAAFAAQNQLVNGQATGTAGQFAIAPTGTSGVIAADQSVVVSLAQSGTAATAGVVTVVVTYFPNL